MIIMMMMMCSRKFLLGIGDELLPHLLGLACAAAAAIGRCRIEEVVAFLHERHVPFCFRAVASLHGSCVRVPDGKGDLLAPGVPKIHRRPGHVPADVVAFDGAFGLAQPKSKKAGADRDAALCFLLVGEVHGPRQRTFGNGPDQHERDAVQNERPTQNCGNRDDADDDGNDGGGIDIGVVAVVRPQTLLVLTLVHLLIGGGVAPHQFSFGFPSFDADLFVGAGGSGGTGSGLLRRQVFWVGGLNDERLHNRFLRKRRRLVRSCGRSRQRWRRW
mmetsp:Transcript_23807/g.67344  ORF Transcript_23807/g.67344 Transcript_23807/m.67344 type:complete len:273 (-) Transcript_23807:704-1522(-)